MGGGKTYAADRKKKKTGPRLGKEGKIKSPRESTEELTVLKRPPAKGRDQQTPP